MEQLYEVLVPFKLGEGWGRVPFKLGDGWGGGHTNFSGSRSNYHLPPEGVGATILLCVGNGLGLLFYYVSEMRCDLHGLTPIGPVYCPVGLLGVSIASL